MRSYPHIAARIFNTALLIHPQKLDAIIAGLGQRVLGAPVLQGLDAAAISPELSPGLFSTRRAERVKEAGWPGYRVAEGVAVVSASGALVHRTKLDANSDLLLGYNDLAASVEHAQDNTDVHAILQVWDSPGGEAQGAFEFGQRMFDMRGKKPMWSIADGMAASAGYLGASGTDQLAVTNTGYAGSIGVVMRHVDFSRMLANDGIAVTHVFAGAHKVDGNPYEALPAAVREDLQAEINSLYEMFVGAVAKHMRMDPQAVRATEARTYMGQAAVAAGLASRIATTDQLISELAALRARSYPAGQSARSTTATQKGTSMSGTQPAADGTTSATAAPALTQSDIDRAVSAAVTAERARTSAILTHAEAAGRTALAIQCVASGLSAEAAGSMLAAAPKAAAANGFAAAMAAVGNPKVEGGEGPATETQHDSPQAIGAAWDKAFGVNTKK